MERTHQDGQLCETILCEYLLRKDFYVLRPASAYGPVDVMAYNSNGDIYLFDAKKDMSRVNPNRTKSTRIHRVLTKLQKKLGVHMAYVNLETHNVHIIPNIEGL